MKIKIVLESYELPDGTTIHERSQIVVEIDDNSSRQTIEDQIEASFICIKKFIAQKIIQSKLEPTA